MTLYCVLGLFLVGIPISNCVPPNRPGGLKFGHNGKVYSFSTDICPGGVFFKEPVVLDFTCVHGYFLQRENGCSMDGTEIIGGENDPCVSSEGVVQAFFPVTTPEAPLEHTLTFFDDEDTLENFRRYCYEKGLEGAYEQERMLSPVGLVISNMQKTPNISLGDICYKGIDGAGGRSYLVQFPKQTKTNENGKFLVKTCNSNSTTVSLDDAQEFPFYEGYRRGSIVVEDELVAELPSINNEIGKVESEEGLLDFEIWDGIAFCLQERAKVTTTGKVRFHGLVPSIPALRKFCSSKRRVRREQKRKRKPATRRQAGPNPPLREYNNPTAGGRSSGSEIHFLTEEGTKHPMGYNRLAECASICLPGQGAKRRHGSFTGPQEFPVSFLPGEAQATLPFDISSSDNLKIILVNKEDPPLKTRSVQSPNGKHKKRNKVYFCPPFCHGADPYSSPNVCPPNCDDEERPVLLCPPVC